MPTINYWVESKCPFQTENICDYTSRQLRRPVLKPAGDEYLTWTCKRDFFNEASSYGTHTHILTRVVPGFKDHGTGSFFIFLQFGNSGLIFNVPNGVPYTSRNLENQTIAVFTVLKTSQ